MRRFGMSNGMSGVLRQLTVPLVSVLGITVLSLGGTGCQNKVYDENVKLREQNRELQARLDEHQTAAPTVLPDPVRPAPPPQPAVVVTPPPAPIAPPPVPAAPAPTDNPFNGLDATVDAKAGTTTVNFVGDALFDPGQAIIKQSAKANLDKVAAALKKQYNGKSVRVQGHTDSDPIKHSKWKDNNELSRARADAVKNYLIGKGVDASLVTSEGFGSDKPKDPGTTTAAKAKNRRVEIVVVTR